MVDYFISSSSGLDSNQGTSSSLPWKTFTNLSGVAWQPGDTLNLTEGIHLMLNYYYPEP